MRTVIVTSAALWVLSSACTEEKRPPPPVVPDAGAQAVAPPIAAPPAPVKTEEISITSTSAPAVAAFERGRAHAEQGRIPEALTELMQAVKLDPKFALALAFLGFYTPTEEGMSMLDRAVTLAAALPPAEKLMVEHLRTWRKGDIDASHAQRKQLKDLVPTDWRVSVLMGLGAQEDRQWEQAVAAFKEATRLNPDAAPAYNLLGYALMSLGKYEEAIKTFTLSTQKAPTEPNALDSLGEAQLRVGNFDAAEASFNKATALSPSYWPARAGTAQSRFLRGDWKRGRETLAEAQKGLTAPEDNIEASTFMVWSYLGEGLAADAVKAAVALENDAKARHQGVAFAMAPILKAISYTQGGEHAKAIGELPTAMMRAQKTGLQGDGLSKIYRTALLWKMIAELRMAKIKDAEKTFTFLDKGVSMAMSSESTSTRIHAQGLLSLARGEKLIALQQLLECNPEDFQCKCDLANLQEQMGDAPAAAATRKLIIAANHREPQYLFARAQAQGLKPAAKK